ncbi:MAG: DNA-processing protein DprA [Clostridiales bacterium]|nr:DNA-processing protein DprA [Clostridiales bacterium]
MYRYWLANIPFMTPQKIALLFSVCDSAEEVYGLSDAAIKKIPGLREDDASRICKSRRQWNIEGEWMAFQEKGISLTTTEDDDYPEKLRTICAPPYALYYIGKLPPEGKKAVAIVGARERSEYGRQVAHRLGEALAHSGVAVISGMARGIDGDGHAGALDGGGQTFAVLGCGADVCYPRQNRALYERIAAEGGIISEFPPGTTPLRPYFPQRNRLISGLSDCTVVVEARKRSGSLITADYALEQGREVYALPGRITDELSLGCNQLIDQGARAIVSVEGFIEDITGDGAKFCQRDVFYKNFLEKDELLVYSLFDFAPLGLGALTEKCPFGLPELVPVLEGLKEKGLIYEPLPHYYVKAAML